MKEYDLVVLGGGTGGYVAAIHAAKKGMSVAVVEKDKLGGTCLHRGCIPTKSLLRSAEVLRTVKESGIFGVEGKGLKESTINFLEVQKRKQKIVDQLEKGIEHLFKEGKIDVYRNEGSILGPSIFVPKSGTISVPVDYQEDNEMLKSKYLMIATGSSPKGIPGLELDEKDILSSDGMLKLEKLPKSVMIVGGGVIGMEWASLLNDFGVAVTVVAKYPQSIRMEDKDVAKELEKVLKSRGVKFVLEAKFLPETLEKTAEGFRVKVEAKGKQKEYTAEKIMVSIGRKSNVTGFGLENTKVQVENGAIKVNEFYQTKESHIYAIGDVLPTAKLAHVAMKEGMLAVDHMCGEEIIPLHYPDVARCIYTSPEVAGVGLTEKEAVEAGYDIKIGKFSWKANGKALVYGESDGFIKVIADKKIDDLLGVAIVGPHATDLINEAALARFLDATPWEIGNTIHAHPTLAEAIAEAALAADGNAIHG